MKGATGRRSDATRADLLMLAGWPLDLCPRHLFPQASACTEYTRQGQPRWSGMDRHFLGHSMLYGGIRGALVRYREESAQAVIYACRA